METRHRALKNTWENAQVGEEMRDARMLTCVASWFGLGFVKGGFVLQMAYGISGCIDARNIDTFGVNPRSVSAPKKMEQYKTRYRKALAYNKLIRSLGGTENLWNAWCTYYAESGDYPEWVDGWQVSAEHCRILGLDPGSPIEED
jgi:hypothetical protein